MGSYGIGPARIVAAAIEQGADEKGIVWPRALAPWQVHLVALGKGGDETVEAAERSTRAARRGDRDVLDDREAGAGEKLTDAELLGCPLRLVVGKRALAEGEVEAQERAAGDEERLAVADVGAPRGRILEPSVAETRAASRRFRSGACSGSTARARRRAPRAGEPLRPLTIPNLVGYLRLAALPVFLVLAFYSDDGRDTAAALIYLAIALGDLVDGFVARATGQYCRIGALLDPIVDRLTVLAGAAVCWNFELLPLPGPRPAGPARARHLW